MSLNLAPDINERRRRKLLRICYTILAGYVISQIGTLSAKILGLTSMTSHEIAILASVVILGTLCFIIVIGVKKKITRSFANLIFVLQSLLFVIMYTIWVYRLNEIRMLGLFFALVALTFELSFTTLKQSLVISLSTAFIQVTVSIYAITYGGQWGSLKHELFFAACFLPSFLVISYIARQVYRKQEIIKSNTNSLKTMNEELTRANAELEKTQKSIRLDMELAAYVQSSIFPKDPPVSPEWDVSFEFRPLFDVSGDFYDFYYREGRLAGISLFDVSGHGVSSALITMFAKPMIFRIFNSMEKERLSKIVGTASQSIYHEIVRTYNYVTGIMLRFRENDVEYVNAGHPDLLFRQARDGSVKGLIPDATFRGKPVGIFDYNEYKSIIFTAEKDDLILLYSDCLIDSMNSGGEKFGPINLMEALKSSPGGTSREVLDFILRRFYSFIDEKLIKDDLTVIVARRTV